MKKIGDRMWYTDPDEGLSSGWYNIAAISGYVYEVYLLVNEFGNNVEAFEHELSKERQ